MSKRVRRVSVAFLAVLILGATAIQAAAIPPSATADAMIKRSTDTAYIGGDQYSSDPAAQTLKAKVAAGKKATFDIRIENDSAIAGIIYAHGEGTKGKFAVTYWNSDKSLDITAEVIAGTYSLGTLSLGQYGDIHLKVKVSDHAAAGSSKTFAIIGDASPGFDDTVALKVVAH